MATNDDDNDFVPKKRIFLGRFVVNSGFQCSKSKRLWETAKGEVNPSIYCGTGRVRFVRPREETWVGKLDGA
jgi:hypothetical protein